METEKRRRRGETGRWSDIREVEIERIRRGEMVGETEEWCRQRKGRGETRKKERKLN